MTLGQSAMRGLPRFDWMQNTVRDDPAEVWGLLAGTLGGDDVEPARGLNGYEKSMIIRRKGETLARVLYGGTNGYPHVIATGAQTDEVVPAIRAGWPGLHYVTRMDSAQDFTGEGGYELVREILRDVATSKGIYIEEIESVRHGIRSRTTYLGAPTSRVRVRLYEKGFQQQQLGHLDADAGWFRMELQLRPTSQDARERAADADPSQAWGFSRWTRDLAADVMGLEVEPVTMQLRREPDYMRAIRSLTRQYSGTLGRALEVEGSWDAVGRLLGVLP